jgi:hypothetical protein
MRVLLSPKGTRGLPDDERLREEQHLQYWPRSAQGNPKILGDDLQLTKSPQVIFGQRP